MASQFFFKSQNYHHLVIVASTNDYHQRLPALRYLLLAGNGGILQKLELDLKSRIIV